MATLRTLHTTLRIRTRCPNICLQCLKTRRNSTLPQAPPLLLKLRGDLKTAMKAKDANRLNVLRALLAEVTNASKTNAPIKTDMQMLSILRKRAAMSKAASEEFAGAGRNDLKEKEDAQIAVIEGYAEGVQMIGEEEVQKAAQELRTAMLAEGVKIDKGSLLRKMVGPGGLFDQKPVDRAMVAKVVQAILNE